MIKTSVMPTNDSVKIYRAKIINPKKTRRITRYGLKFVAQILQSVQSINKIYHKPSTNVCRHRRNMAIIRSQWNNNKKWQYQHTIESRGVCSTLSMLAIKTVYTRHENNRKRRAHAHTHDVATDRWHVIMNNKKKSKYIELIVHSSSNRVILIL